MLKFAHFVIDDKFIPDSIKCFDGAKLTCNSYYYIKENNAELQFLDSNKVKVISKQVAADILSNTSIDVVCLHSLYSLPFDLICMINKNIKVIWYAWGFDLYSNPAPTGPLLDIGEKIMPITKSLHPSERWKTKLLKKSKELIKKTLGLSSDITSDKVFSALNRIDYFSGVFENEFDMLSESQPLFRAKKVIQNYIHPEEFKLEDIDMPIKLTGHNILLGNSATYHINHVDIMYQIKDYVDVTAKIITPLSYQIVPAYVEQVIKEGKRLFGDNFVPLKGYLPFDEYTKIMNSCDSLILGQKQQAATCNCLTAMWNGLKLFLPEDSMNYQYYSQLGFVVFSIEKDFSKKPMLSKDDIMHNRILIEKLYSYRAWVRDLQNTIELLETDIVEKNNNAYE